MLSILRLSLDPVIQVQLNRIEALLVNLTAKENKEMADLSSLTAEVQRMSTVVTSTVALIRGLKAEIAAAGTDPAKLQALQDMLVSSEAELAAAVADGTVAAAEPA